MPSLFANADAQMVLERTEPLSAEDVAGEVSDFPAKKNMEHGTLEIKQVSLLLHPILQICVHAVGMMGVAYAMTRRPFVYSPSVQTEGNTK